MLSKTLPHPIPPFNLRVYYEDTDAGGVVYYANYLKFAERARTEALRQTGIEQQLLFEEHGLAFMVRHCEVDFLKPAKLDDLLTITTHLTDSRGASLQMEQQIACHEKPIALLMIRLAMVSGDSKPVRIPPFIRTALAELIQPTNL